MNLIKQINHKSISIGKFIGAGYVSQGVFVSLSSIYKIQKSFMSSNALTVSKYITPILSLEILQQKISQLSLNKKLYEKVLIQRKQLYEKHNSLLKQDNLKKDSIVIENLLKFGCKIINKGMLMHSGPGRDFEGHALNQMIPIVFHDSFLEQDPLIVLSVIESSIRQCMSEENVFIKEYVKKLTSEHEKAQFKTKISQESTIEDFTKADLIFECLQRNLLKKDEKNPVHVMDSENKEVKIGDSMYSFKLTPLFMALYNTLYEKEDLQELSLEVVPDGKSFNFGLFALPVTYLNQNTFMPTGAQNHINVALYTNDLKNKVLAFGFLTTQKSGFKLAEYQFDIFQQKMNKELSGNSYEFPPKLLPQNFLKLKNLSEFSVDAIKSLKYGKEYIHDVSKTKLLYDTITGLKTKPVYKGNNRGIFLEEILEVCKRYDFNDKNKIPQPKTDLQIKKDNENIEAMKLKAKLLKKCKEQQLNTGNNED